MKKELKPDVDPEVEKLLDRMAAKIAADAKRMREYDKVEPGIPHGIYVYDPGRAKWVLEQVEGGAFEPREDGMYVVYFDNAQCGACRRYDAFWFDAVPRLVEKGYRAVIVLCDWFQKECDSQAARESFKKYDIHSSPTTVFIYVEGGQAKHTEKYRGLLLPDEIDRIAETFPERARRAARGEKVEPLKIKRGDPIRSLRILEELLRRATLGRRG